MLTLIGIEIQAQSIQSVNPQIDQQINSAAENIKQQVIS
jgi:hypothetical protein